MIWQNRLIRIKNNWLEMSRVGDENGWDFLETSPDAAVALGVGGGSGEIACGVQDVQSESPTSDTLRILGLNGKWYTLFGNPCDGGSLELEKV